MFDIVVRPQIGVVIGNRGCHHRWSRDTSTPAARGSWSSGSSTGAHRRVVGDTGCGADPYRSQTARTSLTSGSRRRTRHQRVDIARGSMGDRGSPRASHHRPMCRGLPLAKGHRSAARGGEGGVRGGAGTGERARSETSRRTGQGTTGCRRLQVDRGRSGGWCRLSPVASPRCHLGGGQLGAWQVDTTTHPARGERQGGGRDDETVRGRG